MKDAKFLTIKELMARYNITRKKANEIADVVGTAPRGKGDKIYVRQTLADEYMGV